MTANQNSTSARSSGTSGRGSGSGDIYDSARTRAVDAYDSARERASEVTAKAGDQIDEAPLIALAGGFAVGALIAALLPKTESETEFVRPMSKKFTDSARTAARAARDAGSDRLRELGLTPDDGRDALRKVFDGLSDAARTSADAARGAVKSE